MVTTSDKHVFDVTVQDISADGFRLLLPIGEELIVGERVRLVVAKDQFEAEVRWTAGREAGATFKAGKI